MEEILVRNRVFLRGEMAEAPSFSHESRGERYDRIALAVERLSGTLDTVNVIVRERLLDELTPPEEGTDWKLCVSGQLRSFNNRSGIGARLVITVFAKSIWFDRGEDANEVELHGALCKPAVHRMTPMGREICDLMLAVNRRCGRSDYLPCIAWGAAARRASCLEVGDSLGLRGRLQSRKYAKLEEGRTVEKTAYEISVMELMEAGPEDRQKK